ncbi:pseudouridine synthase [Cupriavidus pauculus]|uniref:Dual-specificity RNA pseudouridine synthase RluF n=1 Tax=Cupriavidus pauculus TaxID=82633 RepID=A0A3G8H1H8_9BURK|nr:pseudouridine synthase [Cupriavidus pauculus]AZG14308.1 pseudouridine synthase [Cupriavidus pauculus]
MTDSNTSGRKTLGVKASTSGAPRKATRPVRVSDLNRKRVQDVVSGIKQAKERAADKDKRKPAPADTAPRQDRQARPARPRPADGERAPRRFEGERDERPRRFEGERTERPRRFEGERTERPRRFEGERTERPRRFEGERTERPRRFEGERTEQPRRFEGERTERPRRFEGERTERPRRFEGERTERPRRFEGERTERPRRFEGERTDQPRRFEGERTERPRRFEGERTDQPRRFEGERTERPRRFEGERTEQPRRFEGERTDRPRRFEGERDERPRRFGDDARAERPRRDDAAPRRGTAPARRFSDSADRARPARPERGERTDRAERPAPQPAAEPREDGLVRLSKRMSELGLCSRREADEWIPLGWVLVDGEPITELGTRVRPDAEIEIRQEARSEQGERVTVLLNKPVGYVSGQAEDGYEPAAVLFAPENQWEEDPTRKRFAPWQRKNLAPAGRLDIDSTGLLVLTQDGRVARALIGDDSTVEKEYLVRVVWESPQGPVERNISAVFPEDLLERLRFGLSLDGVALKPAKVSWQNEEQLRFVLREGRKRQIRRMCEQVGLKVVGLKRVRMGRIALGDLPPGKWRFLGQFEKF